jgi:Mce-associated membrane protein
MTESDEPSMNPDEASRPRPRPRPAAEDPSWSAPPPPPASSWSAPPPPPKARPRLPFVAIAIVGVIVLGLIALNIWLWTVRSDNSDTEQARRDALRNAQQRVPALLSYDYRKLGSYVRTAPDNTTGRFKTDFTSLVARVIAPLAKQKQVVTNATVKQAGIVDASADQVTVLVLLDQTTRSTASKTGQLDGSRDRVVMRKVGGTWLIAALDPV